MSSLHLWNNWTTHFLVGQKRYWNGKTYLGIHISEKYSGKRRPQKWRTQSTWHWRSVYLTNGVCLAALTYTEDNESHIGFGGTIENVMNVCQSSLLKCALLNRTAVSLSIIDIVNFWKQNLMESNTEYKMLANHLQRRKRTPFEENTYMT